MSSSTGIQAQINTVSAQKKVLKSRRDKIDKVIRHIDEEVPGYVRDVNIYVDHTVSYVQSSIHGIDGVSGNIVEVIRSRRTSGVSDVRNALLEEVRRLEREISNCNVQISQKQKALEDAKEEERRKAEEKKREKEELERTSADVNR